MWFHFRWMELEESVKISFWKWQFLSNFCKYYKNVFCWLYYFQDLTTVLRKQFLVVLQCSDGPQPHIHFLLYTQIFFMFIVKTKCELKYPGCVGCLLSGWGHSFIRYILCRRIVHTVYLDIIRFDLDLYLNTNCPTC